MTRKYPPALLASDFGTATAVVLGLLLTLFVAGPAPATPVRDRHVEAELIAEVTAIEPGKEFWAGLRLRMDERWHTYWRNPGDAGMATEIKWDLPEGFQAGEIQWPHPQLIPTPPLVSYGYEGETMLLVPIKVPSELTARAVTLRARVNWLMCKEICIPGSADLALEIPIGPALPDSRVATGFATARAALPRPAEGWHFRAEPAGADVLLHIEGTGALNAVRFFPYEEGYLNNAADQPFLREGAGWTLRLSRAESVEGWPSRLRGVLVAEPAWSSDPSHRATEIDVEIAGAAVASSVTRPALGFGVALLFAFIGGMILNLMPCVFPVLSIKLMGLIQQAGESRARMLAHGLVFAAGVLISFWLLAGALIALRAGGAEIGWGFQLQSPRVVMALASLFFALGLSLFGLLEFGLSLTGAGHHLQQQGGFAGSFFSGLLATIVATPCTAPFMGAALGYALTLEPLQALSIFTALGAGMALPYVALTAMPGLLRRLPKPGPWMESLKEAMGFLMMATVIWLLWVLSLQADAAALIRMAGLFLAIGFSMWIAGRWGALHRPKPVRLAARVLAVLIAGAALIAAIGPTPGRAASAGETSLHGAVVRWEPFTPERVAELRSEGKPVFIDFTAAWCLTCQVNKRVALRRTEVEAKFAELGVATLVADWTDRNETIARALAEFGRSGVPFYVYYPPGKDSAPVILPEVLTPAVVLRALERKN